jgi:phosphoglycerate dehydrogenase-like enzyme
MWPKLTGLKWMHSASAGLEKLLFPELVESNVVLTNAKGVYSHSLAEYVLTCCNWFAKDLPRMRAAQKRGVWEAYDVEELRGETPSHSCAVLTSWWLQVGMFKAPAPAYAAD